MRQLPCLFSCFLTHLHTLKARQFLNKMSETPLGKTFLRKKKSENIKLADQIYTYLRKGILDGEILSRTRLIESEVAAALNASRTPVREAISRLIQDRLVRPLSSGGVEVVDTLSEYNEICYIREALEGVAARLAAENITEEQLERLNELAQASTRSEFEDFQGRSELNWEFHNILYTASRSERLIAMINDFRDFFHNKQVLETYTKEDTQAAVNHHLEIVDALKKRDGERAEQLLRHHLAHFRQKAKGG